MLMMLDNGGGDSMVHDDDGTFKVESNREDDKVHNMKASVTFPIVSCIVIGYSYPLNSLICPALMIHDAE